MSDVTAPVLPDSSDYAQEMVEQGYRPTVITDADYQKMLAQLAALQDNVNRLNAERGVPIDQVDGYRKQLQSHLQVRVNGRPDVGFELVTATLAALPENPDDMTQAQTELLHSLLTELVRQHPGKEIDYLSVLSAELHQSVLARDGAGRPMVDRVTELEQIVAALQAQLAATPAV